MRTFSPVDGCCPYCGNELEEIKCDHGVTEPKPCSICGWEHGEEVLICDRCTYAVDELKDMANGDEYCADCAKGEELADIPDEEVVTV